MDLEEAYRTAIYQVKGGPALRIGENSPALGKFVGGKDWFIVTAWNPNGEPAPDIENQVNQEFLEEEIAYLGGNVMQVTNQDPVGGHVEPSYLVIGISVKRGIELGKKYEQAAIVAGPGTTPHLLMLKHH